MVKKKDKTRNEPKATNECRPCGGISVSYSDKTPKKKNKSETETSRKPKTKTYLKEPDTEVTEQAAGTTAFSAELEQSADLLPSIEKLTVEDNDAKALLPSTEGQLSNAWNVADNSTSNAWPAPEYSGRQNRRENKYNSSSENRERRPIRPKELSSFNQGETQRRPMYQNTNARRENENDDRQKRSNKYGGQDRSSHHQKDYTNASRSRHDSSERRKHSIDSERFRSSNNNNIDMLEPTNRSGENYKEAESSWDDRSFDELEKQQKVSETDDEHSLLTSDYSPVQGNKYKQNDSGSDSFFGGELSAPTKRANVSTDSWKSDASFDSAKRNMDYEFAEFEKSVIYGNKREEVCFGKLSEISGDLFSASDDYSLAHCVAEDMNMGSGIATLFRQKFAEIGTLLDQRQRQGGCAFLADKDRYIYYLVTKSVSSGKPTMFSLWKSLFKMRSLIIKHNVTKLAIPRIGCGLDRLDWNKVKQMLEHIFEKVDIDITVYNILQDYSESPTPPQKKTRSTEIVNYKNAISEMDSNGAIIMFLACEDGSYSPEATDLLLKFQVTSAFRAAPKKIGSIITETSGNTIIHGLVVKKRMSDSFHYSIFEMCVKEVQKKNRKDLFEYVGLQAFEDAQDFKIMEKIVNILRNSLSKVYIYICWPENLQKYMPN